MLPDPTVPASLLAVLQLLRGCFTAPSFRTFCALVTGMIAQTGQRTVTGMLLGAGLTRFWPHDRAHSFFSRAAWNPDVLGLSLSHLVARHLVAPDGPLLVAVDDTLFKRRGKKIFGAAWQHDGAATGPTPVGRGTCFVVIGIVVDLPFLSRPVCLPVLARLWRPNSGVSKVELAAQLLSLLSAAHAGRRIDAVADAAYHGPALRDLPPTCTFTTRLPASAVLYDLAPPRTGKRGRPALKGQRLGTPKELAANATWTTVTARRYRRTVTVQVSVVTCLWYGSFHTRTLRLVLVRDPGSAKAYDLALVTTDPNATAATLIARYGARWSIEVAFEDARLIFGVGQARNRTPRAVQRAVPFGLFTYTITIVWYALHGHHPQDAADHRARAPWYTSKTEPSVADMAAKLRRVIIAARFMPARPGQPTIEEIREVQHAWATASLDHAA